MRRGFVVLSLLAGCAFESPAPPDLDQPPGPRCEEDGDRLTCRHLTLTIATGAFGASAREVHFQVPDGDAPERGWPVVLLFQGSLHSAEGTWESGVGDAFGGYHETELVRVALEAGFAVVTPEARYDGSTYWDTNVPPWSFEWELSEDHQLMVELFDAIEGGELGPLDAERMFAAGISSGGYMTSRMAVSYPGRFRALAIQSASWATCSGFVCEMPSEMSADHPPTLFLHGASDDIVPVGSMEGYAERLEAAGVAVTIELDEEAGHEWLAVAPDRVVAHFVPHAR